MSNVNVNKVNNSLYEVECPYCGHSIYFETRELPWEEGTYDTHECPNCEQLYSIEPVYAFKGFHVETVGM